MIRSTLPLFLVLLGCVGRGPAQVQRVIPPAVADHDANSLSAWPYHNAVARFQQIWPGTVIASRDTAVLLGFAYRREAGGTVGAYDIPALSIPKCTVTVGYTSLDPKTMASTFAGNRTGAQTLVFDGQVDLPAQPVAFVGPWNMVVRFTRPFVFAKSQGNLLMEMTSDSQKTGYTGYWIDGWNLKGYGQHWMLGMSGPLSDNQRPLFSIDKSNAVPGGSIDFQMGLQQNRPALWFIGFSERAWGALPLPLDLGPFGAPQNKLYTGIDILGVMSVAPSGSAWMAKATLPLPNQPEIANAWIYAQAIVADAAANRLGLVFTNVMRNEIGGGDAFTQSMGAAKLDATTASLMSGYLQGPVVGFQGAF